MANPFGNNNPIHPETPNPFSTKVYPENVGEVGTVVKNKPSTSLAHTQALLAKRGELTQQKIDEQNAKKTWFERERVHGYKGGKKTRRKRGKSRRYKRRGNQRKSRRRV